MEEDPSGEENSDIDIQEAEENMNLGLSDDEDEQAVAGQEAEDQAVDKVVGETADSNSKDSETDTAAGRESVDSSLERCYDAEMDRRHYNITENPQNLMGIFWDKAGSNEKAMRDVCVDIKEQMSYAVDEGKEEPPEMHYSNTLMEALREEKKSVPEMILLMDDMIINPQEYMK